MVIFRKYFFTLLKKMRLWVGPLALGRIPGLRSLYFRIISNPAVVNGYRIYLHPYNKDLKLSRKLMNDEFHEEFELQCFKNLVKPGMRVLDIGANIGYYTLLAAKLVGEKGRVFAFEPEPANYTLLRKSVRKNKFKSVILSNKAVSNKPGFGNLFLCEDNLGDHRAFDSGEQRQKIDIEFVTIDNFMEENGYGLKADIIKMDIQGFELYALEGMKKLINHNHKLKLIIEFWPNGLLMAGAGPQKLYDYLLSYGFEIYNINEKEKRILPTSFQELSNSLTGDRFSNLLCSKTSEISAIIKRGPGPSKNKNVALNEKIHVIVCGFRRSGTTWLADLINTAPDLAMLFEPLNPTGIPEAIRFDGILTESVPVGEKIEDLENLIGKIVRKEYINDWLLRTTTSRKLKKSRKIGMKFVESAMPMPWFIDKFKVDKAFFITRHPYSAIGSLADLGWVGLKSFEKRKESPRYDLYNKYWDILKNVSTNLEYLAAAWCLEFIAMKNIKKAFIVKYEDVINQPRRELERIFSQLGYKVPRAAVKRLNVPSSTSYGNCDTESKKNMLTRWENRLKNDEKQAIKRIIQKFGIDFYDL